MTFFLNLNQSKSTLKIRWVNELDEAPNFPGSTSTQIRFAKEGGAIVVSVPFPFPGDKTWQGQFWHGIFYAAGNLERFGKQWAALDAYELCIVSNEQILRLVIEEGHRKGYEDRLKELMMNFAPISSLNKLFAGSICRSLLKKLLKIGSRC